MSKPVELLKQTIETLRTVNTEGSSGEVEKITIPAVVDNGSGRTVDIVWRDHGNGLRSIHLSRPLTEEDVWAQNRKVIRLKMTNYTFSSEFTVGLSTITDEGSLAYGAVVVMASNLDYLIVTVSEESPDCVYADVVAPEEAIDRPIPKSN